MALTNPYGPKDVHLVLSDAQIVRIDSCTSTSQPTDDGEPLKKNGVQEGVIFRDTRAVELGDVFCLHVRQEPQFSMVRHKFGVEQDSKMEDTAMGLVLVRRKGAEEFVRIGLARWVTEKLFTDTEPRPIKLV